MGEYTGIMLLKEVLELNLPLASTAILSMAINMSNDLRLSNGEIGKRLNISDKTVRRSILNLREKGLIKTEGLTSARVIIPIFNTKTPANLSIVNNNNSGHNDLSTPVNLTETSVILSKTPVKMTTINKYIKDKEENKVTTPEKQEYLHLAKLLMKLHQVIDSKFTRTPVQLNSWAIDIRRMVEIDKRTLPEVEEIIRWAKKPGCFWFPNIISGKKLRDKAPTLYSQMQQKNFKVIPKDEVLNKNYAEGW